MSAAALGSFGLALGLFASVAASVLWVRAARGADAGLARQATWTVLLGAVLACGALEWALVSNDFSLRFVAENSSRATPLFFRVTALWSSLGGSLLLWLLVLSAYAVVVARPGRPSARMLQPWAAATVAALAAAFFAMTVFAAQPFGVLSPAPADGPGPNPLLADHPAMGVHPPLLYLGYVGLVVPFAYAVAALVTGEAGNAWLAVTRRWVLLAWGCLTAGIVLGAWWSYAVLGWGGYWAWDPVENASLLPWLTATALLHSALVQRRRRTLPAWNVSLAAASFLLVCIGTFLTRSGVVASVHSFTQSAIGPVLLVFLGVVLVAVVLLLVWRSDRLAADSAPAAPVVSRETGLLANNVLLVGLAVCVLAGTVFPLVADAVTGQQVSVGAPFYDRFAVPAALALLLLVVLAPAAAWDGEPAARLLHRALLPLAAGALVVLGLGLAGAHGVRAVLALGLAAAAAVATVRGVVAHARAGTLRRRRLGGHVAHLGLALAAAGVAASSAWSVSTEASLARGEHVDVGGVRVTLHGVDRHRGDGRMQTAARVVVARGDARSAQRPGLVFFPARSMTVAKPAIWSSVRGDVYVTLLEAAQDGTTARVRVATEPLVGWIWAGGLLLVAGAVVAGVPERRRRTRTTPAEDADEPQLVGAAP
ncbi:MAG TPA: cytochrome c-type biogenesis CcmF C-terminal domain-containing protein [Angustibacter sp.]|nr:cytochrome c-type biogenesis CcmF C-terminal domain-containing protein [Angustibacter sp.]